MNNYSSIDPYNHVDATNINAGNLFITISPKHAYIRPHVKSYLIVGTSLRNGRYMCSFVDAYGETISNRSFVGVYNAINKPDLLTVSHNDLINTVGEEAIFEYALSHDILPIIESIARELA